ncbi:MAG: tyrosine recombinase XerC [Dehalococcoidia bacterium]
MARRARGEGSVYRDGDRWIAAVDFGWRNGRRVRKRRVASTQQEAIALRNELLKERDRNNYTVDIDRMTVGQYLDTWLAEVIEPSREPATYSTYEFQVRLHIKPALGPIPLKRLQWPQIQRMLNDEVKAGLSVSTVRQTHRVLHAALEKAKLPENPADEVELPALRKVRRPRLSAGEVRQLLQAVAGDRLFAFYLMAIATPLRKGELLGLRWQEVDLDAGTIDVVHQLQRVSGSLQLKRLKTDAGERMLALPPIAVEALAERRTEQKRERVKAGSLWRQPIPGLVFTTAAGTPIEPRNVNRAFELRLERAGLQHMRWHDLRGTAATILSHEGVPLRDIMGTLGHSDIAVTANIYTGMLPEGQRRVADVFERVLRGDPEPMAH